MKMSRAIIRQCVYPPSGRCMHTSRPRRAASSPQRCSTAAPELAQTLKKFTDIPGPLALPMLKHSAYVLPRIGNFHHTVGLGLLEGLRERYGDLVRLFKAGRTRAVLYVFDPDMMREVYDSQVTTPPYWEKSPLNEHRAANSCPMNKENTDAIWSGIQVILKDNIVLKKYDKIFEDIAEEFSIRLEKLRDTDNALNEELETELYRWATETLGAILLGTRLGCLEGPIDVPQTQDPHHDIDDAPHKCSLARRPLPDLTDAEKFVRLSKEVAEGGYLVRSEHTLKPNTDTFNKALKAFDEQYSITNRFLHKATNQPKDMTKPEQALLDKLKPLNGSILPTVADVFLAGVDPLAQSALGMFYNLSLYPAQQQRAHDEISWSKASRDSGSLSTELPYINSCVREVMRIHPCTGGVVRRSNDSLAVGGYEVPAGVDIVLAHGVSSKDEYEWGRAKSFIPERWSNDSSPLKSTRAHPNSSMPYGERCPAAGVVDKMLATLAAKVLEKYRLEWHGPAPSMVTTDVNRLEGPYYLVLQKAH